MEPESQRWEGAGWEPGGQGAGGGTCRKEGGKRGCPTAQAGPLQLSPIPSTAQLSLLQKLPSAWRPISEPTKAGL